MTYKKMFFPIGGGEELESRLCGAILVAKYFKTNLEILKCESNPNSTLAKKLNLPKHIQKEIDDVLSSQIDSEHKLFEEFFSKIAKKMDITISKDLLENKASVYINTKNGYRSKVVEQASKFCDLVIAAAPPLGVSTATFEAAVLTSGKPVLMIPRVLETFDTKNIIIGWNNSPEVSRAVTSSIEILKEAQKVHIVSSSQYSKNNSSINDLLAYLKYHNINASYEIVKTTKTPGQALLTSALNGNFDLIIAGAYGHRGLKELMFGGATRYLLEKSSLPVFMSH